jgi:hypothetical protein
LALVRKSGAQLYAHAGSEARHDTIEAVRGSNFCNNRNIWLDGSNTPRDRCMRRVGRQWQSTFKQTNGAVATLLITQNGNTLGGLASYSGGSGPINGFVDGPQFHANVNWNNGSIGVYTAVIVEVQGGGDLRDGRTYDERHPESWAKFDNDRLYPCLRTQ